MSAFHYGVYWKSYGGARALFLSRYLWISLIITGFSVGLWRDGRWSSLSLQIFPNLLGFTLGGYALLLSMGGDKLVLALAGGRVKKSGYSRFVEFNSSYVHFVFMQAFFLISALVSENFDNSFIINLAPFFSGVRDLFFEDCISPVVFFNWFILGVDFIFSVGVMYTLLLLFPTVMNIFMLAVVFDNRERGRKLKGFIDSEKAAKKAVIESRRKRLLKIL
ncbi:hypothetical protein [Chromobacterium violaceum]|uniref:Uncharacterized protein n=1 Tax=Chromobacterium violaceum TaxID=536 RepID=A0AAX2M7H7_CHRVL|nr:hypothetical protein [Chromobacterium violaceum]STB64029.1 Uncharacterised protein [Chromobacterium violaceum]SUX32201.1 Uncharacterised protein [Chromobacterium violaceum]